MMISRKRAVKISNEDLSRHGTEGKLAFENSLGFSPVKNPRRQTEYNVNLFDLSDIHPLSDPKDFFSAENMLTTPRQQESGSESDSENKTSYQNFPALQDNSSLKDMHDVSRGKHAARLEDSTRSNTTHRDPLGNQSAALLNCSSVSSLSSPLNGSLMSDMNSLSLAGDVSSTDSTMEMYEDVMKRRERRQQAKKELRLSRIRSTSMKSLCSESDFKPNHNSTQKSIKLDDDANGKQPKPSTKHASKPPAKPKRKAPLDEIKEDNEVNSSPVKRDSTPIPPPVVSSPSHHRSSDSGVVSCGTCGALSNSSTNSSSGGNGSHQSTITSGLSSMQVQPQINLAPNYSLAVGSGQGLAINLYLGNLVERLVPVCGAGPTPASCTSSGATGQELVQYPNQCNTHFK